MINLILAVVAFSLFVYYLLKWATKNHDVFEKQGIKHLKPYPFLGNSDFIFRKRGMVDRVLEVYNGYPNEKVVGFFDFGKPVYFIRSPELIKRITVKDFPYFQDHNLLIDPRSDEFFGSMLFAMEGKEWRQMRSSLSPVFTGSKMRMMFELLVKCANQFANYIVKKHLQNGVQTYELKNLFCRFTNDAIATCAYGVECDSLNNPDNEIFGIGQELLKFQKPSMTWKFSIMRFFPMLSNLLGLRVVPVKTQKIFADMILNTMAVRRQEGIVRPDLLQTLMALGEGKEIETEDIKVGDQSLLNGDTKKSWNQMELVAQCFLFFLGGFDTTSYVMMYAAYELAVNPDVQEKLRKAIDETNEELNGRPLTYEKLQKIKYLEMVVMETLRKWPPVLAADRKCVKTYNYEDEDGIKFTVDAGDVVWIPVYGFHMDPSIYPDPEKFDPERFSEDNKSKIDTYTFLSFGVGPRNCIGLRFAVMELKILFYYLLLSCRLKICEETPIPLTFVTHPFSLVPKDKIKLHIEPREDKKMVVGLFDFTQPLYFLRTPELVRQLSVKDFAYFQDHNLFIDPDTDQFFASVLFAMEGKQWRDMRSSLSPAFTGSKMRMMLELVVKCAKQFTDFIIEEHEKKGLQTYGLKNIFSRFTNDTIATCAFGVECDSLRHPKNEIYLVGQALLAFQKPTVTAKFMIMRFFPKLAKILGLKVLDDKMQKIFRTMIIDTMDVRKKEGIVRPDMLQILMNMRDGQVKEHEHGIKENSQNGHEKENWKNGDFKDNSSDVLNGDVQRTWTEMELIAQCFLFFLGGFDTTSNALVYLAYELALNPDIQEKLIKSIEETHEELNGKPLTYETLKKMKYLEMVVMEALRKWPPALATDRKCVQTYNYEGEDGLKFTIEKGSIIWFPIYGFHMDPNIFPNPENFDPERFSQENKSKIDPYTFLPFGAGPRNCIGFRFALMEIKVLLYHLLLKCKLTVCEETQIPIKFKTSPFALVPEKEIKLHFEPRKDSKYL